ncbi:recombinase family protein [Mesobacillus subterraneus]|uniref:recombinase family protein n=1 Tax=Mesobacillus subterraneus TaxID=285983 RepID=UPI002482B1B3|nr:recombinase family protein [Mesobacillus subterraneus]
MNKKEKTLKRIEPNHKWGYARVSKEDMDLTMQIDFLIEAGVKKEDIFTDVISSRKDTRPGLEELMKVLRAGNQVLVYKLDRIGRSMKELIDIMNMFKELGVQFTSLNDKGMDTTTPDGKLIFHIMAAFAEFERDIISQRTKSSLKSARARGRVGGRPKKDEEALKEAITLYKSQEYSLSQIKTRTGVSHTTLYYYMKKMGIGKN